MAYTTINKSTEHFDTKLWTGNGSSQTITGYEFQPDMAWIKARTTTGWHDITDAVRGATKSIFPNDAGVEDTSATALTAFTSDGYSFGSNSQVNGNGTTYVGWNWKAGVGQGSSNTDGSINTTYTSVNTTAGFSISKYTGTGSNATVGHGLGVVPKMIMVKRLDSSSDWRVYHSAAGATKQLFLNRDVAQDDDNTIWNDTAPTSSVFTVGTNTGSNASGGTYVAYCWAEKTGFSAFGSYLGNYVDNGPFIYTGMKPKFILIRQYNDTGQWRLYDTLRESGGQGNLLKYLAADSTATEVTTSDGGLDILSNGFKPRSSGGNHDLNGNQDPYLYMAFGQSLVGSNNTPATAR